MRREPRTPEEVVARAERKRRVETELFGTAAGAAAGAGAGALVGPPGIVAGAIIGAAVAALSSIETERVEHEKARHEKELDAIGLPPIAALAH